MPGEATFESFYPALIKLIDKRRASWKLTSVLEWEDVRMILLTHLWEKFAMYDQARPLDNWANTVVSRALMNMMRQGLYKHARPCIAADPYGNACVFNTGGGMCSKTKSGKQCGECHLYAKWQRKKEAKFNVSTPLALENHTHESHSMPEDSVDIDAAKKVLDEKIMEQLNDHDAKLYRYWYIDNLSMEEVGKKMGYKVQKNSKVAGYQVLLKFSRRVKDMAREIISDYELT